MRKTWMLLAAVLAVPLIALPSSAASTPKVDGVCSPKNKLVKVGSSYLICRKVKTKLIWQKVIISTPKPSTPTVTPTPNPTSTPTPTPTNNCPGALVGSIRPISSVTGLTFKWEKTTLIFGFGFDPANAQCPGNSFVTDFLVRVTTPGGTEGTTDSGLFLPSPLATNYSFRFTSSISSRTLGIQQLTLKKFCVQPFTRTTTAMGGEVCAEPPPFVSSLPAPQITVQSLNDGYRVTVINTEIFKDEEFIAWEVWEAIDKGVTPSESDFRRVWQSSSSEPAVIGTLSLQTRWVRARFIGVGPTYSVWSTPNPPR